MVSGLDSFLAEDMNEFSISVTLTSCREMADSFTKYSPNYIIPSFKPVQVSLNEFSVLLSLFLFHFSTPSVKENEVSIHTRNGFFYNN